MKQICLIVFTVVFFGFESAFFAQTSSTDPTAINGVDMAKPKVLKKPRFPVLRKCVFGRNETVIVEAETDSFGKVYKASAIFGHPALRKAAELAARGSIFTPTRITNLFVGANVLIYYGFIVNHRVEVSATIKRIAVNPQLLERCSDCTPVRRTPKYVPKPIYPAAALYSRIEGKVEVEVIVNEDGNVESAKAISGHPLLRASAVAAAKEAKFETSTVTKIHERAILVVPYEFHKN